MTSRSIGAPAPRFTQPSRQIVLMLIICGLVGFGGVIVYPRVEPVFLANPFLNGTIAIVFVVGVLACFWQVLQLFSSVSWIEGVATDRDGHDMERAPRLLAPLSGVFRGRGARMQLTSSSSRSILDSVGARMEESRDITRYIANLLIFLGLLGTFFGLATTVPAVVETIRSLQPTEGEEGIAVFGRLMDGLEDQLGGMGTAFASSLLGLAGSLVVGLLELFAGHGQNRFYREMEEWLSTITRVGFSSSDGDGGGVDRGAIATVLDHMVDQIDTLQSLFAQSESRRAETETRMMELSASVSALTDRLGPGPVEATERLAAAQDRLSEVLAATQGEAGIDAESRMRLRSIDVQLLKIFEEMGAGRNDEIDALRGDLQALTEALKHLTQAAAEPAPSPRQPARAPRGGE
ncbi:biopolymer transporter ExbB [Roseobacter sp. HKCCD9010]|uniref:biopolymer transporter ExbB n=1 Tax=unclassified Roseobacter TaxID=196798 RepID=UPI00149103FC|nr:MULTISPECIES: biopolymer transporter ExbB [unclassified Roseobacter]MBF9051209.1 biopolymer transporter ExbB [Rhodobacterales bacterium HKCCD4356]NNV13256.1 biopolymer transporter ExbB [Roseobacter sp. HKCCD7357]NNV17507.1 biopolymer transporter ExbB [Roseobacter sp. HKCCD8768]NNV27113.1 biopolymer transporter ExbB [Roseobacter sp. HKCCD8192]NNV31233.1 biopolymer transporter ExbB [Roseobacter sp. HKCCD9061]